MSDPTKLTSCRFGPFQLDVPAYQLRYDGRAVRLERRPMDLLILLVSRRGELVTRAEIVARLWKQDVFVEVETGVNTVIWKLRAALRDSPDSPRFIETVPGKGYRFIAAVATEGPAELLPTGLPEAASSTATARSVADTAERRTEYSPDGHSPVLAVSEPVSWASGNREPWWRRRTALRGAGLVLLLVALVAAVVWFGQHQFGPDAVSIAVLPFESVGADSADQYLADGLGEETAAALSQIDTQRLTVVPRTSVLAYRRGGKPRANIARELGIDFFLDSDVAVEGGNVRVTVANGRAFEPSSVS